VLFAVLKPDASSTAERLLLFKRPNVPAAALDWAIKYMETSFEKSVEERDLPDARFTDMAVLLSAVALASGSDFASMQDDAEHAVSQVSDFLQELLAENSRSDIADVHLLGTHNAALGEFLQAWLAPHLPKTTVTAATFWRQPASTAKVSALASAPKVASPQPTFLSMNIRLSQSQPCGFLKRRRRDGDRANTDETTAAAPSTLASATVPADAPPLPPPAAPPSDLSPSATSTVQVAPSRSRRGRINSFVAGRAERQELPKLPFEICIAINRFLAPASAPCMLHRVAEGGPVTYVFLGRANARLFLLHYAPAPDVPTLTHVSAEGSADATATDLPLNALTLHGEWLNMILNGQKTLEIRSSATKKRERIALA